MGTHFFRLLKCIWAMVRKCIHAYTYILYTYALLIDGQVRKRPRAKETENENIAQCDCCWLEFYCSRCWYILIFAYCSILNHFFVSPIFGLRIEMLHEHLLCAVRWLSLPNERWPLRCNTRAQSNVHNDCDVRSKMKMDFSNIIVLYVLSSQVSVLCYVYYNQGTHSAENDSPNKSMKNDQHW